MACMTVYIAGGGGVERVGESYIQAVPDLSTHFHWPLGGFLKLYSKRLVNSIFMLLTDTLHTYYCKTGLYLAFKAQ